MIFGSLSVVIAAAIFILIGPRCPSVYANNLRVVFNNGTAPSSVAFCNEAENLEIDNVINSFSPTRRLHDISMEAATSFGQNQATSVVHNGANANANSSNRELFPAFCADLCAGCVPKTCRSAKCVGYRRSRELEDETNGSRDRNLQVTMGPCTSLIPLVHNAYDSLIATGRISWTCKAFIARSRRSVQCISNAIYGGITGLNALNPKTSPPTMISSDILNSGWNVCRSRGLITLEAMVNECVDTVHFALTGPLNRSTVVNMAPFRTTVVLDLGQYTLRITPNNLPDTSTKIWTFNVNNC